MKPTPVGWTQFNQINEESLASYWRVRQGVPFDRAEICMRQKRGRVCWECGVMLHYGGAVGWAPTHQFFYPTKDMAIAKAVELMLRGIVENYTEGKVK